MSESLKGCPLCGGNSTAQISAPGVRHPEKQMWVVCQRCGCSSGVFYGDAHAELLSAWNRRTLTGAQPAPAAPTKQARVLPNPGSPEASAMLDSLLAEYQWPANSKNAARAGWEAANRWLSAAPAAPPADSARQKSIREDFELIADAHMHVFGMAHSPAREQAWDALKTALERNMNRG